MPDLTLMAVHAHPDDESISTGGILARYAAEGVRTVLVTCTDGGCGDGEGGSKPGDPRHDRDAVVAQRRSELESSCRALGIDHLEMLGYRDSGMMGWPDNDAPGSFWTTPVEEAATRLAELFRRYQPQVVVTYDPNGFYGHPDHIQAHRIAVAAADLTGIPEKIYYTAVPRSAMAEFGRRMEEMASELGRDAESPAPPDPDPESPGPREEWGTPDEEITTRIDVGAYVDPKFESIRCHASQADNIFFMKLDRAVFADLLGVETFVRARDRSGAELPEDDLFAGLRRSGQGS